MSMTIACNHPPQVRRMPFTRAHAIIFACVWTPFAVLTFFAAQDQHGPKGGLGFATLATVGSLGGPMTGALLRDFQSCCLVASLQCLALCGPIFAISVAFQFVPMYRPLRLGLWTLGCMAWFAGGLLSFGHALE